MSGYRYRHEGWVTLVLSNPGLNERKIDVRWCRVSYRSDLDLKHQILQRAKAAWSEHWVTVDMTTLKTAGGGRIMLDGHREPVARFSLRELLPSEEGAAA